MERLYDRAFMTIHNAFQMQDGAAYDVLPNGAFVRRGKDPRSVKERKRASLRTATVSKEQSPSLPPGAQILKPEPAQPEPEALRK